MPEVIIFADIIKIVTIVIVIIKTIIKDSKKVKIQTISVFLDITKFADFRWQNASWLLQSRDLHIFWIFLRYVITAPSFIIVGYVWQILGRGVDLFGLPTPIREQPRKSLSWIGLNVKNCWHQLQQVDIVSFFVTKICWKVKKIDENS